MLHRDILDWEWYQSPKVSRLYFHLILKANFKDKWWQGNLIQRGQLITSCNHLAVDLGISIQSVRTALQKLNDSGYIKCEATNRFTLITVSNYDKLQTSGSDTNKRNNSQSTIKEQSNNIQSTTTKESNKEKKVNKEKIEVRREKFKTSVLKHSHFNNKILENFYNYWSELNEDKMKMRFENERFFELEKRLKKWKANERQFKSSKKEATEFMTNR